MSDLNIMLGQLHQVARLLLDPETPARIDRARRGVARVLREAREHQTQLESWENEGGPYE